MGILGDIIKIAAGVAVGNDIANQRQEKRNNGSGRQNLFGTPSCLYGQEKDGCTVHCNISCPMLFECTQRGRYKVGS